MEQNDKTFRQAIEDLSRYYMAMTTEEGLLDEVMKIGPVVQHAIADGRTIESVVQLYFPGEAMQKAVLMIYRGVFLRSVLEKAFQAGYMGEPLYKEMLHFVRSLVQEPKS